MATSKTISLFEYHDEMAALSRLVRAHDALLCLINDASSAADTFSAADNAKRRLTTADALQLYRMTHPIGEQSEKIFDKSAGSPIVCEKLEEKS